MTLLLRIQFDHQNGFQFLIQFINHIETHFGMLNPFTYSTFYKTTDFLLLNTTQFIIFMNVDIEMLIMIPKLDLFMIHSLIIMFPIVILNVKITTIIFLSLLVNHWKQMYFLTYETNNPWPFDYDTIWFTIIIIFYVYILLLLIIQLLQLKRTNTDDLITTIT